MPAICSTAPPYTDDLALLLWSLRRRARTSLLLVGDPDQLPPVGPGRPFAAALAAGLLPCIDLRQIYRSAAGSAIVKVAHAINQGERHSNHAA
jgi:exodeoxyribonuclease V alpha subunit